MEKLANRIAKSAAESNGLDEEKQRVIAYGLSALIQMLVLLFASLIFGLLFHCLVEAIIIFSAVGLLKSATGGAHARTSNNCTVISLVSIFVMALISRFVLPVVEPYWYIYLMFVLLAFGVALMTVYRRAPVSSANKQITRPEKIRRLRRRSFFTLGIFFAAAVSMIALGRETPRLINASVSLCLAILWQSYMLTESGAKMVSFVDSSD